MFNIHAAFVWVAKEAARFLSGQNAGQKLRFIRMDALSGKMLDIPVMDEFGRIAAKVVAEANTGKERPARS